MIYRFNRNRALHTISTRCAQPKAYAIETVEDNSIDLSDEGDD